MTLKSKKKAPSSVKSVDIVILCHVSDVELKGVFLFNEKMPPKQRKIAVMGFRSVGKSSLAIQFVQVNHYLRSRTKEVSVYWAT